MRTIAQSRVVRFLAFIGFVLYGLLSFPFYVIKNWYKNYKYDREYRDIYTQGKKTFNTTRKAETLRVPKEVAKPFKTR